MSWTQKKLEELYQEINRRLAEDPEFAEKLRKDPGKTLEELAGQPLPEGFSLQLVEKDDNYGQTYVLPDFAGEEIAFSDLDDVAGGKGLHYAGPGCHLKQHHEKISVALFVSACAAAVSITACPADACGAAACPADAGCGAKACGGKACGGAGRLYRRDQRRFREPSYGGRRILRECLTVRRGPRPDEA